VIRAVTNASERVVFQPINDKIKTNVDLITRNFPRFAPVADVFAPVSYWFALLSMVIVMIHCLKSALTI